MIAALLSGGIAIFIGISFVAGFRADRARKRGEDGGDSVFWFDAGSDGGDCGDGGSSCGGDGGGGD